MRPSRCSQRMYGWVCPSAADTFAIPSTQRPTSKSMHGLAGMSPPPAAEPSCPVPNPASRAPGTTSVDSLTNLLRERSQFNFQATYAAIKAEPSPFETDPVSGRRGSNPQLQPWEGCTLPLSYSRADLVSWRGFPPKRDLVGRTTRDREALFAGIMVDHRAVQTRGMRLSGLTPASASLDIWTRAARWAKRSRQTGSLIRAASPSPAARLPTRH
jgi:hypothetical protein